MTYITKKIYKMAKSEALNIRKYATEVEIERLRLGIRQKSLDGKDAQQCVYGLMTGHCWSYRASVLINQCSPRKSYDRNGVERDESAVPYLMETKLTRDYMSPLEEVLYNDNEAGLELASLIIE